MHESLQVRQAQLEFLATLPFAKLRDFLPGQTGHHEAREMARELADKCLCLCEHPSVVLDDNHFIAAWEAMETLNQLAKALAGALPDLAETTTRSP